MRKPGEYIARMTAVSVFVTGILELWRGSCYFSVFQNMLEMPRELRWWGNEKYVLCGRRKI